MTLPTTRLGALLLLLLHCSCAPAQTVERVIVFLIDGLHWEAPARLEMPVFNALREGGTYVEQSYMITPHHPTVGDYGKLHTSSFPNPVLQAGNLFVSPDNKYLQEMISPAAPTAFVGNSTAYTSVSRGFTTIVLDPTLNDGQVVDRAIDLLGSQSPKYVRIHLQTPGNEGRYASYTTPDKPYFRNIWGAGSPYVKYVREADAHLGRLVDFLKESGQWDSTVLFVSSDQGQANIGWHPMIDRDSWRTPLLVTGPTIARGRRLPYFEHTDLTPTVAMLLGVEAPNPNGGAGRPVTAILAGEAAEGYTHPRYILRLNEQINEYNALRARIMLAAEEDPYFSSVISFLENELLTPEPFYHQDRFLEWSRAGTVDHLLEVNDRILEQMRAELSSAPADR